MATQERLMTAEELLELPDDGWRYELVRGVLRRMPPPGARHEAVAARIMRRVGGFVEVHGLGEPFGAPGFKLEHDPDVVRAPDFAFIAARRLGQSEVPNGYLEIPPDLLVEVISPNDKASDVQEKIEEWLRFGVRVV